MLSDVWWMTQRVIFHESSIFSLVSVYCVKRKHYVISDDVKELNSELSFIKVPLSMICYEYIHNMVCNIKQLQFQTTKLYVHNQLLKCLIDQVYCH